MISIQQHVLPLVVFGLMVSIGMELTLAQFRQLLRSPRIPILGSLVHTFTFPLTAVLTIVTVQWLDIAVSEPTIIGMLLIAACPSGGFSNFLTLMARGNLALSVTLTAVSSVASFATVPILMGGFALLMVDLSGDIELPVVQTLLQLFLLVLLPICVGMMWRARHEAFVAAHATRVQNVGQLILYLTVALLIAENAELMLAGVGEALPWSLFLCALNLTVCFFGARLLGLSAPDSVTVAMEGCIRNLAIAFLLAATVLDRMDIAVLPTVYFLAVLVVAIGFAKTWHIMIRTP